MSYTEHRYRSHDGLSLYYRSYGAGDRVVVCLPGLTRNSRDFEDLALQLSAQYRVVTPDLRGRGRSDRDPKAANYHPGTYVRDTWTLLDGLGTRQVALVGTSLGGLMSMIMAYQQPQRLLGVVLNDVGPEIPAEAVGRILQYVGRTPPAASWEAAAAAARTNYGLAFPGVSEEFWSDYVRLSWIEGPDGRPLPDMDPAIGDALRRAQRAVRWLRRLHRWGLLKKIAGVPIDPWECFRAMTMPTLLLQGELSDVLTDDIVQQMRTAKPDLLVVRVPGRGHAPLLDEPESRLAIDSFLAGLA
jgi:pimeloyl-ACP methyl ester carboxylesterase